MIAVTSPNKTQSLFSLPHTLQLSCMHLIQLVHYAYQVSAVVLSSSANTRILSTFPASEIIFIATPIFAMPSTTCLKIFLVISFIRIASQCFCQLCGGKHETHVNYKNYLDSGKSSFVTKHLDQPKSFFFKYAPSLISARSLHKTRLAQFVKDRSLANWNRPHIWHASIFGIPPISGALVLNFGGNP